MRISEAGLALFRRRGGDGSVEYLVQWNENWKRFSLVGGHVEAGESFRACCVREIAEELALTPGLDFRVAPEPVTPKCEYRAMSGSTGVETIYQVQLFAADILTAEAMAKVNADPLNVWLTEPEIRRHATAADRRAVSAQVETMLKLAGVISDREEYDLFVSYAHADDVSDDGDGFVTAMLAALQEEHSQFASEPLRIFFDRVAIRPAQDWEHRLLHGLRASKALLTVLSPAYFASPWCRREWEAFVEHEKGRAWPGDPLMPVYTMNVPEFTGPAADAQTAWLAEQLRAQYCDLKEWRPHGRDAFRVAAVRERMKALWGWVHERVSRVRVVSRSASHGVPSHNRNFVGREADLKRVREELAFGRVTAVTAVSGIGGIGKTALAGEYAHLFADDYPGGRFWLPSETADDLRDLFRQLEAPLGLTFTDDERKDRDLGYARIRAELERRPPSLVVLDNVSKPTLFDPAHISRLRPDGNRVHILMTTREDPPTDPEGWLVAVPLDRLSADDGRALLNRYRDLGTDDAEWHAAREIVAALGGHALSLEVVGVYLWRHPEVRYQDYREWLRHEGLLAAVEGAGQDAEVKLSRNPEKIVSRLLKPTLDALLPAEARAVEYAALLPADWVVMPWLRELVGTDFPEVVTREKPWLPDPWVRVVGRLKGLRLVVPGDDVRLAKMHRVMQAVVLGGMTPEEQEQRRERLEALTLARAKFLKVEWYKAEVRWEIEPLHEFCHHQFDQDRAQGGSLASWIGEPIWLLGRFPDARRLFRRAIEIVQKHFGPDHPNLAVGYSNLGNVEERLGNLNEARWLLRRAVQIEQKHFDPDHPTLAASYSNLGNVEQGLGNLDEARRLLRRAIEIEQKYFDPDHPDFAIRYSILGNVERDLGNLEEARWLFQCAIEINQRRFVSDHPNLAISYSNLGNVERDLGNLDEARQLLRRAVEIEQKCFDPDHANLATRYSNLGNVELDLGNVEEARRLFRRATEIGQKRFDSDHPNLAMSYWNLAMLEVRVGDRPAAVELVRTAYRIWLAKLGPEHPHTKMARDWLAHNE